MKKKNIIIAALGAAVLIGASAVAAYTFTLDNDKVVTPDPPAENEVIVREEIDEYGNKRYITLTKEEVEAEAKWEKTKNILARAMDEDEHFGKDYGALLREADTFGYHMIQDCFDMNEVQIKKYVERLGGVKPRCSGFYCRIRAEVLGKMSADAPRLSVEALDKIVKESHSREELYNNIQSRYFSPDYMFQYSGRSGYAEEYWLDDEGSDWIKLSVVPDDDDKWGVEGIYLVNYEDSYGHAKILYTPEDLKALFSEE